MKEEAAEGQSLSQIRRAKPCPTGELTREGWGASSRGVSDRIRWLSYRKAGTLGSVKLRL